MKSIYPSGVLVTALVPGTPGIAFASVRGAIQASATERPIPTARPRQRCRTSSSRSTNLRDGYCLQQGADRQLHSDGGPDRLAGTWLSVDRPFHSSGVAAPTRPRNPVPRWRYRHAARSLRDSPPPIREKSSRRQPRPRDPDARRDATGDHPRERSAEPRSERSAKPPGARPAKPHRGRSAKHFVPGRRRSRLLGSGCLWQRDSYSQYRPTGAATDAS